VLYYYYYYYYYYDYRHHHQMLRHDYSSCSSSSSPYYYYHHHHSFSRVLVYENTPHNVRGFVHVKKFLTMDLSGTHHVKLRDLNPVIPLVIATHLELGETLALFQVGVMVVVVVVVVEEEEEGGGKKTGNGRN